MSDADAAFRLGLVMMVFGGLAPFNSSGIFVSIEFLVLFAGFVVGIVGAVRSRDEGPM